MADFEEFYATHHRDLARLAYLVVGDHMHADDIAADALLAGWRRWERIAAYEHPLAYVRRTVVNLAMSSIRRSMRERRAMLAVLMRSDQRAPVNDGAAVMDVRAALLTLPPGRRACVILRYALDLSVEDVAEILQIRVGTVKSQTAKGVAQLRASLGGVTGVDDEHDLVPEQRGLDECR